MRGETHGNPGKYLHGVVILTVAVSVAVPPFQGTNARSRPKKRDGFLNMDTEPSREATPPLAILLRFVVNERA